MTELTADCARCAALCCRLSSFQRSGDFAFSKTAGEACRHLTVRDTCAVHAERVDLGLGGCVAFDCHGAGQTLTARFSGAERLGVAIAAFHALVELHFCLRLVELAERLGFSSHVAGRKARLLALCALPVEALAALDTRGLRVVLPRENSGK
jgi:hypothetical protein